MTERGKPAQMLAQARQRIVAELDKAQQATANLGDEVAARNREIAKWLMRSDALLFALDALGPAPVPRGRKPAANGTVRSRGGYARALCRRRRRARGCSSMWG